MRNFTINKLWNIRAELDNAIINKQYDRIKIIKDKYQELIDGETTFCKAFICYNYAFWTDRERNSHNFLNANAIRQNIEDFEKKYVNGEQVSTKLKTQYSGRFLAGEIWVLRAMYDKFLIQSKKDLDELQIEYNMILGKVIDARLTELLDNGAIICYQDQIKAIIKEVRAGYKNIYGQQQPKIDYSQLEADYLEK